MSSTDVELPEFVSEALQRGLVDYKAGNREAGLGTIRDALIRFRNESNIDDDAKKSVDRIVDLLQQRIDRDRNRRNRPPPASAKQPSRRPQGNNDASNQGKQQSGADAGCPAAETIRNGIAYPPEDPDNVKHPERNVIRSEGRSFSEYVNAFEVDVVDPTTQAVIQVRPLQAMVTSILPLVTGQIAASRQGKKPSNILVYGPGGTGKTSSVTALCNDYKLIMIQADGATLSGSYVGQSEKCIREVYEIAVETAQNDTAWFEEIETKQPVSYTESVTPRGVVLFIDEIDSVLNNDKTGGPAVVEQFKTSFQVGSGYNFNNQGCLLIGATNKPWRFDQAVFDRFPIKIYYPAPDINGRRDFIFLRMLNTASINGCTEKYQASTVSNQFPDQYTYEDVVNLYYYALSDGELGLLSKNFYDDTITNEQGMDVVANEIVQILTNTANTVTITQNMTTYFKPEEGYKPFTYNNLYDVVLTKDKSDKIVLNPEFVSAYELCWRTVLFSQRNLGEIFPAADTHSKRSWSAYNQAYLDYTQYGASRGRLAAQRDFVQKGDRWVYDATDAPNKKSYIELTGDDRNQLCFPPPTFSELLLPVATSLVKASATPEDLIQYYEFAVKTNDTISSNAIVKAAAEVKADRGFDFSNRDLDEKAREALG